MNTSLHRRTVEERTRGGVETQEQENCTGSHLENEVTVSSKTTPSKPISQIYGEEYRCKTYLLLLVQVNYKKIKPLLGKSKRILFEK
jgi:hypothetical protein